MNSHFGMAFELDVGHILALVTLATIESRDIFLPVTESRTRLPRV